MLCGGLHIWRNIYGLIGWEYYGEAERWTEKQRQLKYECCKQILKSDLNKILCKECKSEPTTRKKKRKRKNTV